MEIIHEGDSTTRELSKAIGESLDELASCREFLHRIRADGGNAEFFVGWFFDGNRGDLLNCDLLARLADLRIDLSFDVYP